MNKNNANFFKSVRSAFILKVIIYKAEAYLAQGFVYPKYKTISFHFCFASYAAGRPYRNKKIF
ncbi:hypothetical protein BpHYR1_009878 [Brachionus plicatilis]|uniref:Uncharacterized protein n=1 Tax=Brachionus plicatilis TaxID=10195 RepID=A0A3M7RJQ4_BRAPC|nr:hypothetical protein BpHYR1_009878 [Brachionus plicatilis]